MFASFVGGGVYNSAVTLTGSGSSLSGKDANYGGAIYSAGTQTITDSTLSGNFGEGGGIYNERATLTVSGCTLSGNGVSGNGLVGGPGPGALKASGSWRFSRQSPNHPASGGGWAGR